MWVKIGRGKDGEIWTQYSGGVRAGFSVGCKAKSRKTYTESVLLVYHEDLNDQQWLRVVVVVVVLRCASPSRSGMSVQLQRRRTSIFLERDLGSPLINSP